jgi:hypothetical protein
MSEQDQFFSLLPALQPLGPPPEPTSVPTGLTGLYLWLDAADASTITESGGLVSQWNDKSGGGRHFSQATGAAQPRTKLRKRNRRNVLSFDGGDSLRGSTASDWVSLHNGTNYIIALVAQSLVSTESAWLGTNTGGSASGAQGVMLLRTADDRISHEIARSSGTVVLNTSAASTLTGNWNVITVLAQPTTGVLSRSGIFLNDNAEIATNAATGSVTTTNPQRALTIGATVAPSTGNAMFHITGDIGEVVIVTGANATEATRASLHTYLKSRWSL